MPTSRAGEPDQDEMADILFPSASITTSDLTAWPDAFADMQSYDVSWRYQSHSPLELGEVSATDVAPSSAASDQLWSPYSDSPTFSRSPFQQSAQSLPLPSQGQEESDARPFKQMRKSMESPSGSSRNTYQATQMFDSARAPNLSAQPTDPSRSSSTSTAMASAAALRNLEQNSSFSTAGDSQRSYQFSQSQPSQQRTASLQVPVKAHQQGIGRGSRSSSTSSMQLQDEDRLLLRLKEEKTLSWKEIALRFQSELGIAYQIPALQMRYKRLKERMRVWSDGDLEALRQAKDYWESKKWDIISNKMVDFGASEKFSAEACKRKLNEIDNGTTMSVGSFSSDAGISMASSSRPAVSAGPAVSAANVQQRQAMPQQRSQTTPQWSQPQWQP